jgi:3' terminal RNA ribose 2'-O-methyltransferase Hen1
MILTISTTHQPATDLGYLLHKNPSRMHSGEFGFGKVHVLYPEATEERCTAAMVMEVDPVGLVRGRKGQPGESGVLAQYVNDRPYSANSFMVTAIREFFGTAMNGRCKERPELAETAIPLTARLPSLRAKGGEAFVRALFEPLGYEVEARALPLDQEFPEWGDSPYVDLTLSATKRLSELLTHLYVLIPVLDMAKHYWIDEDEVEKLLKRGEGWLATHPQKESITRRYLRHRRLTNLALEQLVAPEGEEDADEQAEEAAAQEEAVERRVSLHDQRLNAVRDVILESGAKRVLDLGCGEGKLIRLLLKETQFEAVVGMDVSHVQLEKAHQRINPDRLPSRVASKLTLLHGSLVYRDARLTGFDAAAVVEVIEHLDEPRLAAFERVLFEFARPKLVVLTTPNREYNDLFEGLTGFRHRDHRFEWTRGEFEGWANGVAARFGYRAEFQPVGPVDPERGAPSQMGIFGIA